MEIHELTTEKLICRLYSIICWQRMNAGSMKRNGELLIWERQESEPFLFAYQHISGFMLSTYEQRIYFWSRWPKVSFSLNQYRILFISQSNCVGQNSNSETVDSMAEPLDFTGFLRSETLTRAVSPFWDSFSRGSGITESTLTARKYKRICFVQGSSAEMLMAFIFCQIFSVSIFWLQVVSDRRKVEENFREFL